MNRRNAGFLGAGLLLALLLAGVVSWYASSSPDGLEKVAEDKGFADTAEEHHLVDWPFADYATKGVGDERLSGGIAGVAGVGITLVLAGGIFLAVRRRGDDDSGRPGERDTREHSTTSR